LVDTASSQAAVGGSDNGDWAETPEAIHGVNPTVEASIGGTHFLGVAIFKPAGRHFRLDSSPFIELCCIALKQMRSGSWEWKTKVPRSHNVCLGEQEEDGEYLCRI
jgi:hypothetical protein